MQLPDVLAVATRPSPLNKAVGPLDVDMGDAPLAEVVYGEPAAAKLLTDGDFATTVISWPPDDHHVHQLKVPVWCQGVNSVPQLLRYVTPTAYSQWRQ